MTASIETRFRNTIRSQSALFTMALQTRRHLERAIHHANYGTLWERVAEGRTSGDAEITGLRKR